MTLNSILNTAATGLFVSQTGMNVVSDNVANANTTGYSQKEVNQTTLAGQGVSVASVVLAANQYLQNASLSASAAVGQTGAISNLLGQAQALFGDPSASNSYFNALNSALTSFTAAANDPADSLNSTQAVSATSQFLTQSQSVSAQLTQLGVQADTQITSDVGQANSSCRRLPRSTARSSRARRWAPT